MDKNFFDGMEIPEELLQAIAGGTLGPKDQWLVKSYVTMLKHNGFDKDGASEEFRKAWWWELPELPADFQQYIDENWDQWT